MTEPTPEPQDTIPAPQENLPAPTTDAYEQEKLSRRAALRKFGFGAGMAALLALSSDDLARMAAARLKQVAGDNQAANQIADEFKNAGVAFAITNPSLCGTCDPQLCDGLQKCVNRAKYCQQCEGRSSASCSAEQDTCNSLVNQRYISCSEKQCPQPHLRPMCNPDSYNPYCGGPKPPSPV